MDSHIAIFYGRADSSFSYEDFTNSYQNGGLEVNRGKQVLDFLIQKGVFFERIDIHSQLRHISRFFENPSILTRNSLDTEKAYNALQESEYYKYSSMIDSTGKSVKFTRLSVRKYTGENISIDSLSSMIFDSYFLSNSKHRPVPSGGAFYPLHFFYLRNDSTDTMFHWENGNFSPFGRSQNDFLHYIDYDDGIDWNKSDGLLVIVADLSYSSQKYGYKSLRLAYLEAGHCAQNIYLASHADENIGVCEIAGIYEDRIYHDLGLDDFIFMTAFIVGHK